MRIKTKRGVLLGGWRWDQHHSYASQILALHHSRSLTIGLRMRTTPR
jgi:hypothetical protein